MPWRWIIVGAREYTRAQFISQGRTDIPLSSSPESRDVPAERLSLIDIAHPLLGDAPVDLGSDILVRELQRGERAFDDRRPDIGRQRLPELELRAPADSLLVRAVASHFADAHDVDARVHPLV